MGLAQTVQAPDLSPMIKLEEPQPLALAIFHQTYIKVNEEGTEAAAATAVTMELEGAASHQDPLLVFDRPFLFVLRHSGSGAVLMLGRVVSPEQAVAEVTTPPVRGQSTDVVSDTF